MPGRYSILMSARASVPLMRVAGRSSPDRTREGSTEVPTDSELAELAKSKDAFAATLVWDRYSRLIRGVLQRSIGPGEDVEDLLQDVFMGFFRNVNSLRKTSSLRAFLIGIAVRTAITELRKRRVRRWLRLSDDGTLPESSTTEGDTRTKEAVGRLYALLDELPYRERMAFVLFHAEGRELAETAKLLGVSLSTVKRLLQRAETYLKSRAREDDVLCTWTEGRDE